MYPVYDFRNKYNILPAERFKVLRVNVLANDGYQCITASHGVLRTRDIEVAYNGTTAAELEC